MCRHLAIIAVLLGVAVPASAADDVLQLRSGQLVAGEVVSFDERGVTLKTEGGEAKYDWSSVKPISQYEVRADRLAPEDTEGHVSLAEFCLQTGLYAYGRREVNMARGLGFADTKRLDDLATAIDHAEADEAFARIDQLIAEEQYDRALDEVSRFVRQAPKSDFTDRAHALAADILKKRDALEIREEEERKADEREAKENALEKRIQTYLDKAEEAKRDALKSYVAAVKNHELTKTKRAKDGYLAAEKHYLEAVQALNRVQRLARRGVTFEKAEKDRDGIRRKLVEVYLGIARLLVDHKNYKGGTPYVNKALYLDPVNEEALDLRKEIDENRIFRSARKLTNTPAVRTGR